MSFLCFLQSIQTKMDYNISNYAVTTSFHIFPTSFFDYHPINGHYTFRVIYSITIKLRARTQVFWNVMLCCCVSIHFKFECFHRQGLRDPHLQPLIHHSRLTFTIQSIRTTHLHLFVAFGILLGTLKPCR